MLLSCPRLYIAWSVGPVNGLIANTDAFGLLLQDDRGALADVTIEPEYTLDHLAGLHADTYCRYSFPIACLQLTFYQKAGPTEHVTMMMCHAGAPQERRLPTSQSQILKLFSCPFLHEPQLSSLALALHQSSTCKCSS